MWPNGRTSLTKQLKGTKEGIIKVLKLLVGDNILYTVTKTANASSDISINN